MRHIRLTALTCGALLSASSFASAQTAAAPSDDTAAAPADDTSAAPTNDRAAALANDRAAPESASAHPAAPAAASRLTPPRLIEPVQPVYPDSQRASGRAAHVELILTLDDTGSVSDVSVSAS